MRYYCLPIYSLVTVGYSQINPSSCRRHFLKKSRLRFFLNLCLVFSPRNSWLRVLLFFFIICHLGLLDLGPLFVFSGCLLLLNLLPPLELFHREISQISPTLLLTKISAHVSHIINCHQLQGRKLTRPRPCRSPEGFPFVTRALCKLGEKMNKSALSGQMKYKKFFSGWVN